MAKTVAVNRIVKITAVGLDTDTVDDPDCSVYNSPALFGVNIVVLLTRK